MRKAYFFPTTEIVNCTIATFICASPGAPDLGKNGNTSDLGGGPILGD